MRQIADTEDWKNPLVQASQYILDPALSATGQKMAEHYRPLLHQRLKTAGFDVDAATIGFSGLRRARETAQILFPGRTVHHLPHIKEHGDIPENTPMNMKRCRPDWRAFLKHMATLPQSQFAVVGHGSFLKSEIWRSLSKKPHGRFHNLDGLLITAVLTQDGDMLHPHIEEFKYKPPAYISGAADKCSLDIERKIATHCKMKRMTKKTTRRQRGGCLCGASHQSGGGSRRRQQTGGSCLQQRNADSLAQIGGGVNMPLAYFQDGAQMRGTYPDATGTNLAGSNTWVRAPLAQTGGSRKQQKGGFTPSVMGSFLVNGSRLIPAAGYMSYRMFEKSRKTRRGTARKHRVHRTRRSDRD